MLHNSYPYNFWNGFGRCVVLLVLTNLVSACGDDLSDLDALAKQSILDNSDSIEEVTAQFSVEQLVSSDVVSPDTAADDAQFDINLATNVISGQVNLTSHQNTGDPRVQIRRGYAGKKSGLPVLELRQDTTDLNQWYVPDHSQLSDKDVELLLRGGLYVLVTTEKNMNGELRGQLLWGGQQLEIIDLSGANLIPEVTTSASGKAYLTPISFDGTAQAIVRISGITNPSVILFRANNPKSTERGHPYFELIEKQDYWEFPPDWIFSDNDFREIGKGNLMFIVTSASHSSGEIGGRITFAD